MSKRATCNDGADSLPPELAEMSPPAVAAIREMTLDQRLQFDDEYARARRTLRLNHHAGG